MPKFNLTRRWIRSRPGSVLILVIALLVLLALIGTAYLSSTQTERYTSVQNSINTEADLLIQGLQVAANSQIAGGLYSGTSYRPPSQDMPSYPSGAATPAPGLGSSNYYNYDSTAIDPNLTYNTAFPPPDLFLSDRIPFDSDGGVAPIIPTWNKISWPLFTDGSGSYTFDSPFGQSVATYYAINKGKIVSVPTYETINGTTYPGMIYYVPPPTSIAPVTIYTTGGVPVTITSTTSPNGGYITSNGFIYGVGTPALSTVMTNLSTYPNLINFAASASGDGIADAGMFKLPVGQMGGVTYYGAMRVVDGNSAVNVSSANTLGIDTSYSVNPTINYGFFRSNVGLAEILNNSTTGASLASVEMSNLNKHRFGLPPAGGTVTLDSSISSSAPTNFTWYSYGDAIDSQLTRRPGNPGTISTKAIWFGQSATSLLAYKGTLVNPYSNSLTNIASPEYYLQYDLLYASYLPYAALQSAPWSPAQTISWWNTNFYGLSQYAATGINGGVGGNSSPVRTLLVGNNAVSNAVPPRYGNASSTPVPAWQASTGTNTVKYKFGDWVTDSGRSYVCICDHTASLASASPSNEPLDGKTNSGAVGLWAGALNPLAVSANLVPGVPWTSLPVKVSINTAPFEQLWLNFCHVMTDSISSDPVVAGALPQWQPPMQAATAQQMPMFKNVVRDPAAIPTHKLTSSQMLKLRAALAAVNAMDLRDSDDDVTSQRIVLTDDTTGLPIYDVEVYGTEMQPFIGQVYMHVDSATPANNFVAIQLLNPYDKAITIQATSGATAWKICTVDRSLFPNLTLTDVTGGAFPTGLIQVPARTSTLAPGILVLTSSASLPSGYQNPPGFTPLVVPGLATAVGKELMILKPRLSTGTTSSLAVPASATAAAPYYGDYYTETNISDLVPVDQIDSTGLATTGDYYYRRGSHGSYANKAGWNFVYPGPYIVNGAPPQAFSKPSFPASVTDPNMGAYTYGAPDATGSSPSSPTFTTVPVVLNNTYMAGPNRLTGAVQQYPFGGFMREGDLLQIPFIGSYRIRPYITAYSTTTGANETTTFMEMNSVTMDSSFASDPLAPQPTTSDTLASAYPEQLGRFCPVGNPTGANDAAKMDFGNTPAYWHYHWVRRLFDYFTVQAPSDDYYPYTDPAGLTASVPPVAAKYPPGSPLPVPVANNNSAGITNAVTAGHSEDTVGVEGRININTASVPVLAQVPFTGVDTSCGTAAKKAAENALIAQAIVADRNTNGPFKSIFDLYRVPAFQTENTTIVGQGANGAGAGQGLFSPNGFDATQPNGDGVRYDFKERFLLLNNISNLITTRSDTFTVYLLLQGWRNVGTGNPTLVVQRRLAYLVDRNGVTPSNNQVTTFPVPSQ